MKADINQRRNLIKEHKINSSNKVDSFPKITEFVKNNVNVDKESSL